MKDKWYNTIFTLQNNFRYEELTRKTEESKL